MTNLPTISNYGEYSSKKYGAHTLCVSMFGIDVYFSYNTPIAFRTKDRLVVIMNYWGPTTGKHLNWIDGGDKDARNARVPSEEFERLWDENVPLPFTSVNCF